MEETADDDSEDDDPEYLPQQRNLGKVQHRKFTGFDQRLPMVIYGTREETVHGTSAAGVPHTLIVFRWALQQRAGGRRFQSIRLRAAFQTTRRSGPPGSSAGTDTYYDPHVVRVVPSGTYSMLPTTVTQTRTRAVEGGLEGGVELAKGTAKVTYKLSETVEATRQIVINGSEKNDYDSRTAEDVGDPDRCNVAEWNLFENEAAGSGLPTCFRTAVLLERREEDEARFLCTFKIRGQVDFLTDSVTSMKRVFGVVPRDDPIIFDPSVDEGGPLAGWKDKLDEVDMLDLCKFVMFKSGLS
ncbi:hypothetical protein QBC40DRAFT_173860 [Triangularia verruculosa]|uniref:Uncharacterized protein n=1 Tax=Triangularia verruculosa TaxID=2587418 RepID=A0AAN7AV30_9PEZI|nr:hypothetical protein QBC40DRAFT_173860 [Triangularia verruculosa]